MLVIGMRDFGNYCVPPHIHHVGLILDRIRLGKKLNESDDMDHHFDFITFRGQHGWEIAPRGGDQSHHQEEIRHWGLSRRGQLSYNNRYGNWRGHPSEI